MRPGIELLSEKVGSGPLAYRDTGVLGVVPPNALLTVEATVLSESDAA